MPWTWLAYRLALVNFLVLDVGFMGGNVASTGGVAHIILVVVYLGSLFLWLVSLAGVARSAWSYPWSWTLQKFYDSMKP